MVKGYELIFWAKRDEKFGPIILFGLGSIYVEIFKDITFRLVPIREFSAYRMIEKIRGYEILKRAESIERISQLI